MNSYILFIIIIIYLVNVFLLETFVALSNVMIPHMNYLVEKLSVCYKGINIEVLKCVLYAISVSVGSKFLNSIEACRPMMDHGLL